MDSLALYEKKIETGVSIDTKLERMSRNYSYLDLSHLVSKLVDSIPNEYFEVTRCLALVDRSIQIGRFKVYTYDTHICMGGVQWTRTRFADDWTIEPHMRPLVIKFMDELLAVAKENGWGKTISICERYKIELQS